MTLTVVMSLSAALVGRLFTTGACFGKDSAVIWEVDEDYKEEPDKQEAIIIRSNEDTTLTTDASILPPGNQLC